MLRRAMLLVALSAGLAANQAHATYYAGDTLLELCEARSDQAKDLCRGYISGIDDSIEAFGGWNPMQMHWCIPRKVTLDQLQSVVTAYLRSHPRELHLKAATHVANAFIASFPCE